MKRKYNSNTVIYKLCVPHSSLYFCSCFCHFISCPGHLLPFTKQNNGPHLSTQNVLGLSHSAESCQNSHWNVTKPTKIISFIKQRVTTVPDCIMGCVHPTSVNISFLTQTRGCILFKPLKFCEQWELLSLRCIPLKDMWMWVVTDLYQQKGKMNQTGNMWKTNRKIPKLRPEESKLLPFSWIVHYLISDFILQWTQNVLPKNII